MRFATKKKIISILFLLLFLASMAAAVYLLYKG